MQVNIQVIPHNEQRYGTAGDWFWDDGMLNIRVSSMGNTMYEQLVAFHEYVEAMLCYNDGVSEESVTEYDKSWEEMRAAYPKIVGHKEPGNSSTAPYQRQHQYATKLEYMLCKKLGIKWDEYSKAVLEL